MIPELERGVASRIPAGQRLTQKWPVLTYGGTPSFDPQRWTFRCFGLVEHEVVWTWGEFLTLPQVKIVSDVHCVTHWSRLDDHWEGVHIHEILRHVRPKPGVVAVMVHADPDYTTNIALDDLAQDDVLLALKYNDRDLEPEHGGPCRLVIPRLYFWKSAKWVRGFEFLDVNPPDSGRETATTCMRTRGGKNGTRIRRPGPCSRYGPRRLGSCDEDSPDRPVSGYRARSGPTVPACPLSDPAVVWKAGDRIRGDGRWWWGQGEPSVRAGHTWGLALALLM